MNSDPDLVLEEEFTALLLAGEEALADGTPLESVAEDASPELQARLLRSLMCVQRLQQLRRSSFAYPPASLTHREDCPTRIGRFEIRCLLGRGGFGIVYRAYDPVLCREVALKIPRSDTLIDAECLARFQREALAAAGLDHPNLVPVHEAGELGPICYIAFAYCPGSDLATWLQQRSKRGLGPVPCMEAARLVRTLARAIHYAHGRGILHRDLKPSNILLSPVELAATPSHDNLWAPDAGSALIPRVTDFGLAKFADGEQAVTGSGSLLGTPCYMAPEQTEGKLRRVGPETDVYALGAILYEVLTGRPPFHGDSAVETLYKVKTTEPERPSRLRPETPRDLETICLTCLHKDPRKRYPSAEALADDLCRLLTGRPIQARPSSFAEQVLKWAGRHPALATSLGALLLVTVLGVAGIFQQWRETQDALAEEASARHEAELKGEQARLAQQAEAREHEKSEVALYHHRVMLAHHEWLANNIASSARLLDDCRADLRHWEWRYVHRLCDSALYTCTGHSTHVASVAVSSDGRYLASAAGQWNSADPGEVKLWDAASGELRWTGLGHTGAVMSVAFSPDGSRLASATTTWGKGPCEIIIWETATGKLVKTLSGFPSGIFGVAYSQDGTQLATAGADSRVRLWDVESGRQLFVLSGHRANVFSVAFSPDGSRLASAGWEGTALVWDLASRKIIHRLRGPADLRSVAFSPDGQLLVAASWDHSVKIWDAASGELLRTYWGHRSPVLCAAFDAESRRVASTDYAGAVHIWDAKTARILRTIRGHTGPVNWTAFSPNGRLATAGRDRKVRLWDVSQDQEVHSLPQAEGAKNVVFSPRGRFLYASGYTHSSGAMQKSVRVWAMPGAMTAPVGPRRWQGHTGWPRCVAVSADEKLLASGGSDRTVRLWDIATESTQTVLQGHTDMVTAVAFPRDGARLASASLDKTVRLWDLAAAQPTSIVLTHLFPIHDLAYAPDGKRLVAVGRNGMVVVWAPNGTGTKLHDLSGHHDDVERVVFSPDGRLLATGGADRIIRIWNMTAEPKNGQPAMPLHTLTGHTDRIVGLSFSPDGRRLASASADASIRIWDVASASETLTLRGHPDSIYAITFSPDGRLLVSASSRDIKIWDAGE